MKKTIVSLTILLALLACVASPPGQETEDRRYGVTAGLFSGRWWNYFDRGASYAEGRFFTEAIADFHQAISQRAADQWRARTYGMHFIDYFPHRELGVIHYQQQRYDEAAHELEQSLRTASSAKAMYFLNLARKALLQRTGLDHQPPVVTIDYPLPGLATNVFALPVRGVVEDDTYVARVKINSIPIPVELAVPRFEFQSSIALAEGVNTITVTAEDLAGRLSERTVQVIADWRGPLIGVIDFEDRGGAGILRLSVTDETGIANLSVNSKEIHISKQARTLEVPVEVSAGPIQIFAEDVAGNRTSAMLSRADLTARQPSMPMLASLDVRGNLTTLSDLAPPPILRTAWLSSPGFLDTDPPLIMVQQPAEGFEVFQDTFLIEGKITDASEVVSLTINGEEMCGHRGRRLFFSALQKLHDGDNTFAIMARDSKGNTSSRTLVVKKKTQKVKQLGARMSIALLPLQNKGNPTLASEAVYDKLIAAFVNQRRFQVIERQRLHSLLQELKMSATDLVNPEAAARMGRLIAADAMLFGTILEAEHSIEVITHLVDTETSAMLSSNDVYDEDKSLKTMESLMEILAFKFRRDFPLLEGRIIDTDPKNILVDLGEEDRIRQHSKLICYRENEANTKPATGRRLAAEPVELGEVRIEDVFSDYSKAAIIRQDQPLRVQDRVITK